MGIGYVGDVVVQIDAGVFVAFLVWGCLASGVSVDETSKEL